MLRVLIVLLSCSLAGCYDRNAEGELVLGSEINLYTLTEQSVPIGTTNPIADPDRPFLTGLINFSPMPDGYSAADGYYLVEACGGSASDVPQDGCRYIMVDAKFFFLPADKEDWEGQSGLWNITPTTDEIARLVKDTFSHQEVADIRTAVDNIVAEYFPAADTNGDGVVTYEDIVFGRDYDADINSSTLSSMRSDLGAEILAGGGGLDFSGSGGGSGGGDDGGDSGGDDGGGGGGGGHGY